MIALVSLTLSLRAIALSQPEKGRWSLQRHDSRRSGS
jgi:hypothetical protein